jgi:RNA polymerase sigma-70 factor (ECF subfamily)
MTYEVMSDEDLTDAYYGCDDQAFAELYRRYFPALVAFLRRQGVSREDAEDLAEETFLRVIRTKGTGRGRFDRSRSSFRTWLFIIARNALWDHWRRQGIQPHFETEREGEAPPVEEVPSDESGPAEALEDEAFSELVHDCLGELPAGHREVLLLSIRGFKLREIAQILQIPSGTAGRWRSEARQRIRECLIRKGCRVVPGGSELPPGTSIVLRFADELLVRFDLPRLEREGYRFVPVGEELPQGVRVVLAFPDVVLMKVDVPHQEIEP